MLIFVVLSGLCVLGLAIRTGYELLKDAGRIDPESPAVFAAVFCAMGAVLLGWPFLCALDPFRISMPPAVRVAGLIMFAAGLLLAAGAFLQLRGLENIDRLVNGGLFAVLRHPMYTGFILWISGWTVYRGAPSGAVLACACIACILFWGRFEERRLENRYGEIYRKYRKSTWF